MEEFDYPEYSARLYAKIANQYIGKEMILPSSRKYSQTTYFVRYIHQIPRNIQQRLACGNCTSWFNMVYLYNQFADELGFKKITCSNKSISRVAASPAYEKEEYWGEEEMIYLSDGVYIRESECWF